MKKSMKNQNGAISLFVLLSMMFFLAFMLGAFTLVNRRNVAQIESLSQTKKIYSSKANAKDIYDSIFANEKAVVPIISVKQLKDALSVHGTENQIKYLINGKVYTYKNGANYILQNDIILNFNDVKGNASEISFTNFEKFLTDCTENETFGINLNNYNIYYRNADENLCRLQGALAYFREDSSKDFTNNMNVISKYNLADYLGRKVTYTPSNKVIYNSKTYETSSTYRVFYVDFDNKYGDGKGTIYIKADYTNNNYPLSQLNKQPSSKNKYLKLNPTWYEKTKNEPNYDPLSSEKGKAVAWLLEPDEIWDQLKDNSLGESVKYVVGSPTIELYIDSYNTYLEKNPNTLNASGTEIAKQIACDYVKQGEENNIHSVAKHEAEGYIMGFKEDTTWDYWDNTVNNAYYTLQGNGASFDNKTLLNSNICNGIYNPGLKKNAWIASPSSGWASWLNKEQEIKRRVVSLLGEKEDVNEGNQSRLSSDWYNLDSNLALSPVAAIVNNAQLAFSE